MGNSKWPVGLFFCFQFGWCCSLNQIIAIKHYALIVVYCAVWLLHWNRQKQLIIDLNDYFLFNHTYAQHLFRLFIPRNVEIPRVISALQQQNTAPEVQQYDSDAYQTDGDGGGGKGEIKKSWLHFCVFHFTATQQKIKWKPQQNASNDKRKKSLKTD